METAMTSIPRATARPATNPRHRRGFIAFLWQLAGLRRQRRMLVRLDDHALRDIGLTRADAQDEAARPIWDVPSHWRS
jgi:uncharacterized protein YjiS (DUF1127 family)